MADSAELSTRERTQDPSSVSASAVTRVVKALLQPTKTATRQRWLQAVATRTIAERPDLRDGLTAILGCEPFGDDILKGLSIGEVGVCYEALIAKMDAGSRKVEGQFFTPDDAAQFMAQHSTEFPEGIWLDPCCGVGNLAWHLVGQQSDPDHFVTHHLALIDKDETALHTAVAMIGARYVGVGNADGLASLASRAVRRDFLSPKALPQHDFVIVNPPYARADVREDFRCGKARDLFAYFMERVACSASGFIAVTPASYLNAPKFQVLREVISSQARGGRIYVFDNVPDTLFRGYKFGSSNTSKTNFVRAAITVCRPHDTDWEITPILRWRAASRSRMFANCGDLLVERRIGPGGEWVKLIPGMEDVWERLANVNVKLQDLLVSEETPFKLTVATTPRYYVSAAYRELNRGSKAVLHFANAEDRDLAALVLNSSLPYIWWRALDGGVTLPTRVLHSLPIPQCEVPADLECVLRLDEEASLVTKLNAGKINENVKRPRLLVETLDAIVIPDAPNIDLFYADDMFPEKS